MKQDRLQNRLDRVIGWINNCDQKASILLAFIGVAFPLLVSSDFATNTYKELISDFLHYCKKGEGAFSFVRFFCFIFTTLSVFGLGTSFVYLLNALLGRVSSLEYKESGLITKSFIFFGSLSKMTYSECNKGFRSQTKSNEIDDLISQLYINSKICQTKFDAYNKALCYLKLGVLFLLATFITLLLI